MASLRKRGKVWYYRFTDENGEKCSQKGCPDKKATEQLARDAETLVAMRKAGRSDPAAERFAECACKPIAEHVDDFAASMNARGRDAKHTRTTRTYVERIVAQAKADHLSDLTPSAVELALGAIEQKHKLSARAVNAHAIAVKAFVRWAWEDRRIRAYELGNISKRNEEADKRYVRRPLTDAELRNLIATTHAAPEWRGISGVDRSWFYAIGAVTGLRRSELGGLRPEDFDLQGPMPFVCLDGSRTKNGRECQQPLPPGLAAELGCWLAAKAPGCPLFALPEKTALMLHADLERCGIEPVDAKGRVVDTHSLRHGYISALAVSGVPLKVTQTLARHCDPKLTMNTYAHLNAFDLHGAIADALPDLTQPTPEPEDLAATGTDGRIGHRLASEGVDAPSANPEETWTKGQPINDRFGHYLATGGDGPGGDGMDADGLGESGTQSDIGGETLKNKPSDGMGGDVMASDRSAPRRTRTYNPLIKRLLPSCPISSPVNRFGSPLLVRVAE
jgi:integrase